MTHEANCLSGALARASATWSQRYGSASCTELASESARAIEARSRLGSSTTSLEEDAELLCREVEAAHVARHGQSALAAELADERDRDAAIANDAALVRYEAKWNRKLARLQRAHRERWRVPVLSEEEVRDALTLRLIEVVRDGSERAAHARAGKEWGLVVCADHLATLRKSFRLDATPTDFSDAPLLQREPSYEDRWLEVERDVCLAIAQRSAQNDLSRPQRRWLSAMKLAANAGEFFESSDRLNLSAASRLLGKNRSSAQRAYKELQSHFMRELERFDER
jgi:hypothetical protein